MFEQVKESWKLLRESKAGERFRRYNERQHAAPRGGLQRGLRIGAGIATVAVGVVLLPAPGPGALVVAAGAAILSRESKAVARSLDWSELRMRSIVRRLRRREN
jgi:hypothetical protein